MIQPECSAVEMAVGAWRHSNQQCSGAQMARDVFISYATQDKAVADAACPALELQDAVLDRVPLSVWKAVDFRFGTEQVEVTACLEPRR